MLSIALLGPLTVHLASGAPLAPLPPRGQTLAALLLLSRGRGVERAWVAGRLWPDSPAAQALTNLRGLLLRLGRSHPEIFSRVEATGSQLTWASQPPCVVDVDRLEVLLATPPDAEGLRELVELYRGDLCEGVEEEWITHHRRRLRIDVERALAEGASQMEERRALDVAILAAERLLRLDPLREETYRRLMRLYALGNDRARALQTYQLCTTRLGEGLDVAPSRPTRRLYRQLSGREEVVPDEPAGPPLVGREPAWRVLLSLWEGVVDGRPSAVAIAGDAGVGKTRLVGEVAAWVERQGARVVRGRCYAAHRRVALDPVVRLLRALPPSVFTPGRRRELARLLPELGEARGEPLRADDPLQRLALFEAIGATVLSQQPLLLLLDDLHWADDDTVLWLHHLLRLATDARLLVVLTLREEDLERGGEAERLLADLTRERLLHRMNLAPLAEGDAATLATLLAPDPALAAAREHALARARGNPLYLLELLRAAAAGEEGPLPETISATFASRLARLSAEARECADLVAIIGRACSWELIEGACRLPVEALDGALEALWAAHILVESTGGRPDLSHPLLAEYLTQSLPHPRRRRLHRAVAAALQTPAGRVDGSSQELALHLAGAGQHAEAAAASLEAGHEALRRFAYGAAVGCYRQARVLAGEAGDPGLRFQAQLAEDGALMRLGRYGEREVLHREMASLAGHQGRADWLAETRLCLADNLYRCNNRIAARAELDRALDDAAGLGRPELEARILELRAMIGYHLDANWEGPLADLRAAAARFRQAEATVAEARAQARLGAFLSLHGRADAGEAHLSAALQALRGPGCQEDEARALIHLSRHRLVQRRPADALEAAERAVGLATETGYRTLLSACLGARLMAFFALRRCREAVVDADEALAIITEGGPLLPRIDLVSRRSKLHWSMGDAEAARRDCDTLDVLCRLHAEPWHVAAAAAWRVCLEAWAAPEAAPDPAPVIPPLPGDVPLSLHLQIGALLHLAEGLVGLHRGAWDAAEASFTRAIQDGRGVSDLPPSIQCDGAALLAEVALARGEPSAALVCLAPGLAELDRCPGHALFPHHLWWAEARARAALGDTAAAHHAWSRAEAEVRALQAAQPNAALQARVLALPLHQAILRGL